VTRRKEDAQVKSGGLSRRSLIASSAGVATTMAVTAVVPAAAVAIGRPDAPATPVATPSTPIPSSPIVAYVHDAARGEVTVVSGRAERTYRDPALVRRLVAAAKSSGAGEVR